MSRKTRMKDIREAKDRRAKKMAIGGAVLLAIVLAWEVPHFLGGKKSATPAATTTSATAPVDSTTPGATTPATTAGVTPASATPLTASPKLTSSDLPPRRSKAQLASFSTFASKDPFIQQVTAPAPGSADTSSSTGTTSSTTKSRNKPVLTARTLARSGAVRLSVNGRPESVRIGASFPSANPVFRLVSVTRGVVKIGIANGTYSSGAQAVALRLNSPLTLVDSTNGVRYKLLLLAS
jgi:hypothetical protein